MIKKLGILLLLPLLLFARSYELLPELYRIKVGSDAAPNHIIEYFSLSCPLCLKLLQKEFEGIYQKEIATHQLLWEFHPDPQDMATLQLMVCLENLPPSKRWPFFWEIVSSARPNSPGRTTFLMEELMKRFLKPLPHLHDIHFLETTPAYKEAFEYLKQKEIPDELPALELNGHLIRKLPTQKTITPLLQEKKRETAS